jgi:hypothetical protein
MLAFPLNSALQLGPRPNLLTSLSSPLDARTRHDHPRSFFSYTYKLPIFYPLCFDIHASHAGCTPSQPFDVQTFQRSNVQRSISFLLTLFRTLLHFFALTQNSTPFVSCNSALFRKNTRGGGGGGTASAACSELLGAGGPQKIAGSRVPQSRNYQVSFEQTSASFGPAFFRLTIRSGSWRERACTISTLPPLAAGAYSEAVFAFR